MKNKLQKYQELWWMHQEGGSPYERNCWVLSDREDMTGYVSYFTSDNPTNRIDRCIEKFREIVKENPYL